MKRKRTPKKQTQQTKERFVTSVYLGEATKSRKARFVDVYHSGEHVERMPGVPLETKGVQHGPTTLQDMADGFRIYAETITKILNEYACRQNDSELARLYVTYRQDVLENWRKLTKKYLNIDLPEPPTLNEGDYYKSLIGLAQWCSKMAKGVWQPLTQKARIIRDWLTSLPEGEARKTKQILRWYENDRPETPGEDVGKSLDDGTWKKIRKELIPYGLQNLPRIGYFIRK